MEDKINIDNIIYFNGNTLHITENSILSYQNRLLRKMFNLDDLSHYYKNRYKALDEINNSYSELICVFICFIVL